MTGPSPVETRRLAGPCAQGGWPGYSKVYQNISEACDWMGRDPRLHLSDEHVDAMAALGSGHEERMKAMQFHLRDRGLL